MKPLLISATIAALMACGPAAAREDDPLMCAAGTPSPSTGAVSIGSVVRAIVCQNSAVQRRQGLVEQARAAEDRARGLRQPSVRIDTSADAVRHEGSDLAAAARLSWTLFDFGAADAQVRQARRALEAVLDEQRVDTLAALAEGAQSFAGAEVAQGRYEAAVQNLRTAQDSLAAAQARRSAGAASASEQLSAQTAVHQARFELTRAHGDLRATRGALALAMGLRAGDLQAAALAVDDTDDGLLRQPIDFAALVDEARERHPRVLAARSRLEESVARETSLRAQRWGQVDMNASAGRERSSTDSRVQGTATAALRWTLPLMDRGERDSSLRDALAQTRVGQARLADALRQTELQVWQDGQALLAERAALREGQRVLDSAMLALQADVERYRLGAASLRDVLAAQTQLSGARYQWVEVRARARQAGWRLAAALGRLGPLGGLPLPPP
ncbi:TolC family protein [Sphaerotilus microaerophilus]|uniref:Protein CyaE n=1 Tax=Sphaerotilus microaerophilus TaxID=2914710 RepID=A0ABN6PVX8_9BURK|nr:TolC family protein [Sphaerotilus sp. FB-5]BDI08050.1 protein CyaE [Sphaerotilus sp. FB-5]